MKFGILLPTAAVAVMRGWPATRLQELPTLAL